MTVTVTAKFKVDRIDNTTLYMSAVTTDKENKDWAQYTPWGTITMGITNPTALKQFEVGSEYLLTFEKA